MSFWADKPQPATCGEAGADAEYTLPRLAPFQATAVDVTVPYTSSALVANATVVMRIFIDSRCGARALQQPHARRGPPTRPALPKPRARTHVRTRRPPARA